VQAQVFVLVALYLESFGGLMILPQYFVSLHNLSCIFKLPEGSFTFQTTSVPLAVAVIELIITFFEN